MIRRDTVVKRASMKVLEELEEEDVSHFHKLSLDEKT